jgi:uncharacterized protein (DUF58 family)
MLPPELIKKIKRVHIRSGRLVNTLMAGQYRSVFRGTGMEFEEVREYTPGDDVKDIDWKVSARMGRPYIKRYREERERVIMLLLDLSASMQFGTRNSVKTDVAAETASILAFNAIRNNDKVGALLFTDRVEKYIPPQKGSGHVWRVIKEFFSYTPQHSGTDIGTALDYLGRVCRKRTVSFLISDFISGDYLRQLKIISKKHEIISILLSDPGDFSLPPGGVVTSRNRETGGLISFDAFDRRARTQYSAAAQASYRSITDGLKSADVDCVEIRTESAVADALTRYFRIREKRMR